MSSPVGSSCDLSFISGDPSLPSSFFRSSLVFVFVFVFFLRHGSLTFTVRDTPHNDWIITIKSLTIGSPCVCVMDFIKSGRRNTTPWGPTTTGTGVLRNEVSKKLPIHVLCFVWYSMTSSFIFKNLNSYTVHQTLESIWWWYSNFKNLKVKFKILVVTTLGRWKIWICQVVVLYHNGNTTWSPIGTPSS